MLFWKIMIIIAVLFLLVLPFLPFKFPLCFRYYVFPEEKKRRNVLNLLAVTAVSIAAILLMTKILKLADWVFSWRIFQWIGSHFPSYVIYDFMLTKAVFANYFFCFAGLLALMAVRIGDRTAAGIWARIKAFFKKLFRKRKQKAADEAKSRKERRQPQIITNEKAALELEEKLIPEPEEQDASSKITVYLDGDIPAGRKNPFGILRETGASEEDNNHTHRSLGDLISSLFYEKVNGRWMSRPQCRKVAKHLRNFLLLTGVFYLLCFFLLLIPTLFKVQILSEVFYTFMIRVAKNCYLYPAVSMALLLMIYWCLEEKKDDVDLYELAEEQDWVRRKGVVVDLDEVEEELIRAYGKRHDIKSFYSEDVEDPRQKRDTGLVQNQLLTHISRIVKSQGLEVNEEYLRGIQELENGKDVLFDAPLSTSVAPYLYAYLNSRVASGERIVVVCQRANEIESVIEHFKRGFSGVMRTHTPLWDVAGREQLRQGRGVDVLVVTPEDLCDDALYVQGKEFFSRATLALLADADRIVSANNYYCLVMSEKLRQKTPHGVQFVFLSTRNQLNLQNSLRQYFTLEKELHTVESYYAYGGVRVYIWKTRNDGSVIIDNGAKTVLLEVAISNLAAQMNIPHINVVSEGAIFPSQADSGRLDAYDLSNQPIGFAIVADDQYNLPGVIYSYSRYIGKKASVLHIISKPYLLRDYFYENAARFLYERPLMEEGIAEHADLVKNDMIILLCRLMQGIEVNEFAAEMRRLTGEALDVESINGGIHFEQLTRFVHTCLETALSGTGYQATDNGFTLSERTDGRFQPERIITIHQEGALEALLRDTSLVQAELLSHGKKSRVTLDLFRKMLNQRYLPGQNLIYNHQNFTIRSIDAENGILHIDDANSVHGIPQDYVQLREYTISEGMDAFADACQRFSEDGKTEESEQISGTHLRETGEDICLTDLTMVRAKGGIDIISDTVGYYMVRSDAKEIDLCHEAMTERTLSETAREGLRRHVDHALYLRLSGEFAQSDELTMTLAVLLQEMMKTLFPRQYFCISVCPILKNPEGIYAHEELLCRQIARMYPRIVGWDAVQENSIELLIVDDCEGGTGVLELLYEPEAVYLKNILGMLSDYLEWQKNHEKGSYIYFGAEEMPAIFQMEGLKEILNTYATNYIRESDIYREIQHKKRCTLCGDLLQSGQSYLWGNGHMICQRCAKEIVPSREEAQTILTAIQRWLTEEFQAEFPDELSVANEPEEFFEEGHFSELNLSAGEIILVDDLQLTAVHKELLKQLVTYWQLKNLIMDGRPEADGQVPYVTLQYLTLLKQYQKHKRLSRELMVGTSREAEGYRLLAQGLRAVRSDNSFAYLLEGNKDPGKKQKIKQGAHRKNSRVLNGEVNQYYFYNHLNDGQKQAYERLLSGVTGMETVVAMEDLHLPADDAKTIYLAMTRDHPELFWLGHRHYTASKSGEETILSSVELSYVMSAERKEQCQKELEAVIPEYLQGITQDTGDYDAALLLYERIIDALDYDSITLEWQRKKKESELEELDEVRNIYTALVKRKSVCVGYAKAYQYLLQRIGIECLRVDGEITNRGGHAWNIVKLEGSYYHVDTTWGDGSNTDPRKDRNGISYGYFALPDRDIRLNRSLYQDCKAPKCLDDSCNYFVRNHLFFLTYDFEEIKKYAVRFLQENDARRLQIRFANRKLWELAYEHLIYNGGFREILREAGIDNGRKLVPTLDDTLFVLGAWLKGQEKGTEV